MPDCYRKGKESGLWYEIKTIEDTIRGKEAAGKDATFEKSLLTSFRSFARASGYHSKALTNDWHFNAEGLKGEQVVESSSPDKLGLLGIMLHPGRPPKAENEPVSRMTLWRRQQKQSQAALL